MTRSLSPQETVAAARRAQPRLRRISKYCNKIIGQSFLYLKYQVEREGESSIALGIYWRFSLLFRRRVIKLSLEISYGIGMSIADICPRPPSLSLQPRSTIIIFCHLTVSSLSHSSVLGFNQLREKCQK